MMRALGAAWLLVSHPLRSALTGPPRGVYDDHGAARATRRRRGWWWVLQLIPAVLWAALAVWRMTAGEVALGIAYIGGALALVITTAQIRSAYLTGYMRGGLQIRIDARARAVGQRHDISYRAMPHPADPTPDVSLLYGRVSDDEI